MSKMIDDIVKQIDDAIKANRAYLWQDNMNENVDCIPLHDYTKGENTKEDSEKKIKVVNIIPLWNKLRDILNAGSGSLIQYEDEFLKLIDEQIKDKVSGSDLREMAGVLVHKIFITGKGSVETEGQLPTAKP